MKEAEKVLENDEMLLQSVKKKTLSREVEDRIIELLTNGKLKPGDRLPTEMDLMKMLSVSRPVLREAMSSLTALGIVNRNNSGTFFSEKIGSRPFSNMLSLAVDDLPAIIEARMALELGLVALAAEKITDTQLEALHHTIELINTSTGDYSDIDKEFHRIIALSASNQVLEGMIDSLLITFDKMSKHIEIKERTVAVEHHTAIYNALSKRSSIEAVAKMHFHLDFVRRKIFNSPPEIRKKMGL
jgi:GntR family transcriptional regulator, transcriptional repressor for pyruvate dehydrogenase complex